MAYHADTIEETKPEVKPEAVAEAPPVVNFEYDTPPAVWVAGTTYDPDKPVEDLTNQEYAQWAYDNRMPFWAIKANLLYRTPPTISAIEPTTAAIGDPSFTLYVTGTNFHPGSIIVFAGQDENTTLNEDGKLQTGVNMSYWHGPDTIKVAVKNGPGGVLSDEVDFVFTAAPEADTEAVDDHYGDDHPAKKAKKKK
jgi:hypothetical protein